MNSILYEIQRTFRSKFVIAMVAIIILIGALIAYELTTMNPSIPRAQRVAASGGDSGIFSGIDGIFGLLIPILAVFMGYLTYGKDRTSGVLESVITRPVTKGELVLSRFTASVIAVLLAVVISTLIIDLGYYDYFSAWIPANIFAALVWSYLVMGAGFLGLVYLFSHLLKSQSAVLGISIGIYLIFALLWGLVTDLVLHFVFNAKLVSLSSIQGVVNFNFGSPSGYRSNLELYVTKSILTSLGLVAPGSNQPINPAHYGITLASLGVIGSVWIVVPVLITYALAKKFD